MPPRRNSKVVRLQQEWLESFPDLALPAMTTEAQIDHVEQMLLNAVVDPSYRPQALPSPVKKPRSPHHLSAVAAYDDLRSGNVTALSVSEPSLAFLAAARERNPADWIARFYRWVLPRVEEATADVPESDLSETMFRVLQQALADLPTSGPMSLRNDRHISSYSRTVLDALGLIEAQRLLETFTTQAVTGLQTAARQRDLEREAQVLARYNNAVIQAGLAQQQVEVHNQRLIDQYRVNKSNVELERGRSWFRSSVASPVYPQLLGDIPPVPVPDGVTPVRAGDQLVPVLHRVRSAAPQVATKNQERIRWRDIDIAYRRLHHLPPPPPPPGAGGSSLV